MPDIDLSQQSFWDLLRLCCSRQRLQDVACGYLFLGVSIFLFGVYYYWPLDEFWKERTPFFIIGTLAGAAIWFMAACFKSPLAWVRGEPEDSEILLACIKRCFCWSKRPPARTSEDQMQSRPNPDDFIANSTNANLSVTSLLASDPQSSTRRVPLDGTNTESDDSGIWACLKCIWCRKSSNREASSSSGKNVSRSSTDPTDRSSSQENIEMMALNPEQQGPSSSRQETADVTNSAKSEKLTCSKSLISCQFSDTQGSTGELIIHPTEFITSSSKDLEINNESLVQIAISTDGEDQSADSQDGSVTDTKTANLHLEQQSAP